MGGPRYCSLPGCTLPGVHAHLVTDDDGKTVDTREPKPPSVDEIKQAAVAEFCRDIGVDPATTKVSDVREWIVLGKERSETQKREMAAARERSDRINHAGWGRPLRANVWHYFPAGTTQSICGRCMYAGSRDSQNPSGGGNDDCKTCSKKVAKLGTVAT